MTDCKIDLLVACAKCLPGAICGTGSHGTIMCVHFLLSLCSLLQPTSFFLEDRYPHIERPGSMAKVFFVNVFSFVLRWRWWLMSIAPRWSWLGHLCFLGSIIGFSRHFSCHHVVTKIDRRRSLSGPTRLSHRYYLHSRTKSTRRFRNR